MPIKAGRDFLEHYGVLGMKWGVRKQPDGGTEKTGSSSDKSSGYEPKDPGTQAGQPRTSRTKAEAKKNYKAAVKKGRKEALGRSRSEKKELARKHANAIVETVAKHTDDTMVRVGNPYGQSITVTGKEFYDYLKKGGSFQAEYTTIDAPKGSYINEHHPNAFSQETMREISRLAEEYKSYG